MTSTNYLGFLMSLKKNLNKNIIKKNRKSLGLDGYTNTKRKIHFLSPNFSLGSVSVKPGSNFRSEKKTTTEFLNFFLKSLGGFYIIENFSNNPTILWLNIQIIIGEIFKLFGYILFFLFTILLFSGKKFERSVLNKILIPFTYMQLILITEGCILLSGTYSTWIIFKTFNFFLINGTLWFGKNDISILPEYNKEENNIFWKIKTCIFALGLLDLLSKFFVLKHTQVFSKEILNFSKFTFNCFVTLSEKTGLYDMGNLWRFLTLSSTLMLISSLLLLYFIAFVKITLGKECSLDSIKSFMFGKFIKQQSFRNNNISTISSKSGLDYQVKQSPKIIEDLMSSERVDLYIKIKEKNSRWKIKKKGIKTPFSETVWNNELPLLKQNLWYEIKSK